MYIGWIMKKLSVLLISLFIFQLIFFYYRFYKKLEVINFLNKFWLSGLFLPLIIERNEMEVAATGRPK